ncbi:LamG-like jellyroll fold domain-containing protein [Paenibacillus tarimensis]
MNLDTASNWARIFDFGSGTSTFMFLTPKNGSNVKNRFGIKNNNSSQQIIEGTSALPIGGWYHVAVTLNGSNGTLYVRSNSKDLELSITSIIFILSSITSHNEVPGHKLERAISPYDRAWCRLRFHIKAPLAN